MMDSINQWLDPVEVRRLAERLMVPSSDRTAAFRKTNPAADDERPPGRVIPAAVKPVPEFAAPEADRPRMLQIDGFRRWLSENHAATGIFILDHEGSLVFNENNDSRLHLLARTLAVASGRAETPADHVRLKISAKSTLEIIPIASPSGHVVLGALVEQNLSQAAVAQIRETFQQTENETR